MHFPRASKTLWKRAGGIHLHCSSSCCLERGSLNSWEMGSRGIVSKGREPALSWPPEPGGKQSEQGTRSGDA